MPRFPACDPSVDGIRKSVFARLIERMAAHGGPRYPLHIGDTWFDPPETCQLPALAAAPPERPYAYSHPFGTPALRAALVDKLQRTDRLGWAGPDHVTVTCGATHALFAALRSVLSPGDEVIVPSPYWPLISGVVRAVGGTPVEVPFWTELADDPADNAVALLEPHLTGKTAALYLNTPNNPTGRVLSRAALTDLVQLGRAYGLWLIADEAYEGYQFGAGSRRRLAALPGAAERTLSAFSFSKTYALAGYRAGYLVGPEEVIARSRKVTNHSVYSVPGVVQEACLRALQGGGGWLATARKSYADAAALVTERLHGRFRPAEGAAYVWLEVGGDSWEFLDRALSAGVSLAPGAGFGDGFDQAMRLCYVACDLDTLAEGIEALNGVLDS